MPLANFTEAQRDALQTALSMLAEAGDTELVPILGPLLADMDESIDADARPTRGIWLETYAPSERGVILRKMQAASNAFYGAAARAGCHAFIEFTGLMNEFIKACNDAHRAGEDFTQYDIHNGRHLPLQPYHVNYLNEKLECIFGRKLSEGK